MKMRWRTSNSGTEHEKQPQPAHEITNSHSSDEIDDDEQDYPVHNRYDDDDIDLFGHGETAMRGISPTISRQVDEFEELVGDLAQASVSNMSNIRHSQVPSSSTGSLVSSLPPPDGDSQFPSALASSLAGSSSNAISPTAISAQNSGGRSGSDSSSSEALSTSMKEQCLSDVEEDDDDDDPGQDHAVPDEGQDQATEWSAQSQQSTCEFTHTISNYSSKRESGCKKAEYSSTTVDSCGNRWRLIVYVNGNGRASNHHLSLFLQVADADDLPFGWKKAVSYVLTLEHPSGPNLGYAKRNPDKTFKLCPKAIDWGWSQFITSDRIQQEGYISNDSLTVRASVTVKSSSISIDPEDAELYLKCAVEEGNAEAVELCLAQGASVNCQFKDDLYTPLHTACSSTTSNGSLEVLKLLLRRGADGNACNKWRETPLLIAANNGHKAAVEALLKSGANPSLCSEAGWSALTFAAHKGYDDIVTLLLNARAPVNCRVIEDLSTPLHKACAGNKSGHLSAVKQLLKGGADVHALNKWRETPLLTAANHGQASAVEALLDEGGDPCKCTDTGWSPLSIAAYKGHDEVVRLLLEQGAPTEEADPTLSALLQAATKGLPDTVELLLRHGADHSVTTKKGDTALSILVEQNLIDAAVEMVTEYKASVPRCSRDRKKVQRARLLINLRVKKQKGMLNDSIDSDDGDSDQDDSDIGSRSALHDGSDGSSNSPPPTAAMKNKKNKKRAKERESAEAEAKAAEEALLLELEQEDAKAQKDEAAANSKRNKKKKRKERERQRALEEERLKKDKEEKEAAEKERKMRLKEEKQRKEQKEKERLQQEAAEKEEKAAAKRRLKEMKLKEQENKGREKATRPSAPTAHQATSGSGNNASSGSSKDKTSSKVKSAKKVTEPKKTEVKSGTDVTKAVVTKKPKAATNINQPKPSTGNRRGWENKNVNTLAVKSKREESTPSRKVEPPKVIPNTASVPPVQQLKDNATSTTPQPVPNSQNINNLDSQSVSNASVEDQLENITNGVVGFLGFDSPNPSNIALSNLKEHGNPTDGYSFGKNMPFEPPAISLYRQEKVADLLQRLSITRSSSANNPLMAVDDHVFGNVIYKWIVRAAYESSPCLDPLIPSWTDTDMLVAFFQRQFISESRRGSSLSTGVNIEILKEAGTLMADLCFSFAKEVSEFNKSYKDCLPQECNDSNLGLVAREMAVNGEGSNVVAIDWAERSRIFLPALTFTKLRSRHCGPPNQLLASVYSLAKRYETMRMILSDTTYDYRLPLTTLNSLSRELSASMELWSDPLCALDNYNFCGIFSDVDSLFGGYEPFGKAGGECEVVLMRKGGSVVVLPPLDSITTTLYVKRMLCMLQETEGKGIPMSFAVFLPMQCFRDLSVSPTIESLELLDSRFGETHRGFITVCELLHSGQYSYKKGDGTGDNICHFGSLFLLLQNDSGRIRFSVNENSIANILNSFAASYVSESNPGVVYRPLQTESVTTPVPLSPNNTYGGSSHTNSGITGGNALGHSFPKNGARKRGRLFELVDDGEDDTANEVDDVSGMLNNLDIGMFQNNPTQDVDIEAISLMGIGKKW